MSITLCYDNFTGPDGKHAWALGYRFDAERGRLPECSESHLLELGNGQVYDRLWKPGLLTAAWSADNAVCFAADAEGYLHRLAPKAAGRRARAWPLHFEPAGVWGLADDDVYVWGVGPEGPAFAWFDGSAVNALPSPDEPLVSLHGNDDLLIATGSSGRIHRFHDGDWEPDSTVLQGKRFTAIHLAAQNQFFACGKDGALWEGTQQGWTRLVTHADPLHAVVSWKDRVWVATTGEAGLCEWVNGKLESRKPNLRCTHLEARTELMISCPDAIVSTADGEAFAGQPLGVLETLTKGEKPAW